MKSANPQNACKAVFIAIYPPQPYHLGNIHYTQGIGGIDPRGPALAREGKLSAKPARRTDGVGSEKVLTVREVALSLKLEEKVISKLLESGDLMGFRIGDEWRIMPVHVADFLCRRLKDEQLVALRGINKLYQLSIKN